MKLNRVYSNISTKLLAHFCLNIQALAQWSINIEEPNSLCVRWACGSDLGGHSRFDAQQCGQLIEGYSIACSTAAPDEIWESIQENRNDATLAIDSLFFMLDAEDFVNELFTDEEASILARYLASLDCAVKIESVAFPVSMEAALPVVNDGANIPFEIELPDLAKVPVAMGVVSDWCVTTSYEFVEKSTTP